MYINLLIRFGCEMCSFDRLVDYVVFDGIKLDERERIRIVVEERLEVFFQQVCVIYMNFLLSFFIVLYFCLFEYMYICLWIQVNYIKMEIILVFKKC